MKKIVSRLLPYIHGKYGEQVRTILAGFVGSLLTSLGVLTTQWFGYTPDPTQVVIAAFAASGFILSAINTWAQAYVAGAVVTIQEIINTALPKKDEIAVDAWPGKETKAALVKAVAIPE